MAHYEDLTIDQGSDLSVELRLINKDQTKKDLTGYSVAAKLAPNYNSSDSDKVSFVAIVAAPDSDGIVNLSLTNAQTDALSTRRKYVYDVEISYVDSDTNTIVERILEGNITVKPSVTK
jgi:hypothetical protein